MSRAFRVGDGQGGMCCGRPARLVPPGSAVGAAVHDDPVTTHAEFEAQESRERGRRAAAGRADVEQHQRPSRRQPLVSAVGQFRRRRAARPRGGEDAVDAPAPVPGAAVEVAEAAVAVPQRSRGEGEALDRVRQGVRRVSADVLQGGADDQEEPQRGKRPVGVPGRMNAVGQHFPGDRPPEGPKIVREPSALSRQRRPGDQPARDRRQGPAIGRQDPRDAGEVAGLGAEAGQEPAAKRRIRAVAKVVRMA